MISSAVLGLNVVRFSIAFADDSGAAVDPTAVSCTVYLDGSQVASLTVVKADVGSYVADWDTTGVDEGTYWVVAAGTGDVIAGDEIRIKVRAPHDTP